MKNLNDLISFRSKFRVLQSHLKNRLVPHWKRSELRTRTYVYSDPNDPRDVSPEAAANLRAMRDGVLIDDPICLDPKRKEALWRRSLKEAQERLSGPNPNTEGDFGFADGWADRRRAGLLAARIRARWALEALLQASAEAEKDHINKVLCALC